MTDNKSKKKSNLEIATTVLGNHQRVKVTSQPSQKHEVLSFRKIMHVELFTFCFSESLKCI